MKNLEKHIGVLEYLKELKPADQKRFIQSASKSLLHCLSEICLNLVRQNISLNSSDINKLKKYEKEILTLSEKRHSLKKRKQLITRGGLLNSLLHILPAILTGILSSMS